jgi:hypothetical protein
MAFAFEHSRALFSCFITVIEPRVIKTTTGGNSRKNTKKERRRQAINAVLLLVYNIKQAKTNSETRRF